MFGNTLERRLRVLITVNNMQFGKFRERYNIYCIYHTTIARKTPRSAQGSVLYLRRFGESLRQGSHGSGVLVSEKERGPREASEAS